MCSVPAVGVTQERNAPLTRKAVGPYSPACVVVGRLPLRGERIERVVLRAGPLPGEQVTEGTVDMPAEEQTIVEMACVVEDGLIEDLRELAVD
jgi:hypothetical protein